MARASRFPDDGSDLARIVRDLQRVVRELAAAPRGANTALTTGQLTLVGAGGQRLGLTPTSPLGFVLPDGSVIYPPAVTLASSPADIAVGALATYRKPTVLGSVPVATLVSPQGGPTVASVLLQGGEDGGETALATLAAAGANITLTPTGLTISLGSASMAFTAAGIGLTGTPSSGWTEDVTTQTTTSITYADAGPGAFSATMTVPPSGRVWVDIRCTQRAATGLNALTSWRAAGATSGVQYTENDTAALVVVGGNNQSLSLRHRLSGLTPGELLTVTIKHRLNAAGTLTVSYRSIGLEPCFA